MKRDEGSSILGIGNDIIEIERIRKSIETHGHRFIAKIFTQKEQEYCSKYKDPILRYAGRFSAKEAIVKALGSGFGEHASWHDMEIINDDKGKPIVVFSPKVKEQFNDPLVLVSISHSELYATAVAIWVNR
jgi:holo-[acyl-carrier protein] synthase